MVDCNNAKSAGFGAGGHPAQLVVGNLKGAAHRRALRRNSVLSEEVVANRQAQQGAARFHRVRFGSGPLERIHSPSRYYEHRNAYCPGGSGADPGENVGTT